MGTADRITTIRLARGVSQDELALALRKWWPTVHRGTISKIERGVRSVAADELPLFAAALACDIAELVDPEPKPKPPPKPRRKRTPKQPPK